ncbi:hypothetical protein [Nocardia sp. NPDC051750]|uniref:hypothetical protein n=1 Tax=Nocardia sp. NPDC051750 TaxID=3364325 RepID=UPI0037A4928C
MEFSKRRIEHTTPGPVTLTLHLGSGQIGLTSEDATATAVVNLSAPPNTPAAAAVTAALIEHHGNRMTVETPAIATTAAAAAAMQITGPAGDIALGPGIITATTNPRRSIAAATGSLFDQSVGAGVFVPAGSSLHVRATGPIVANGSLAHVDAVSAMSVYLLHAEHADIATDTGDIEIARAAELHAVTREGSITATVTDRAALTVSVRGDITVHARGAAHITAYTAHGDITVHAHTPGVTTDLHARNGTVRIISTRQ